MATNVPLPVTCYIAGAMASVPKDCRDEISTKRKAIAKFFQDGYSLPCSHHLVLTAHPEISNPQSEEEKELKSASIVARDLTLVNSAEFFVLCYEGYKVHSWGAAIELGYAYANGKTIVLFNLSEGEDLYFFLKCLPQDKDHKVYIIKDEESLDEFTRDYKCELTDTNEHNVERARKKLKEVIFESTTVPNQQTLN